MPFEAGQKKIGGRTKGTPNKATTKIREALHGFLEEAATKEKLIEILDELEAKEAAKFLSSLFKYAVPIQTTTTHETNMTPEERDAIIARYLASKRGG